MMSLPGRRLALCIAPLAAAAGIAMPATANAAAPEGERLEQCAGAEIIGRGSTFQNPAQLQWESSSTNTNAFNLAPETVKTACSGHQGSKAKPVVVYRNTEKKDRGSGSCLHAFGAETAEAPLTKEYSFCGTDEAPNEHQREEIENHRELGAPAEQLETVPIAQGAVAILIHLPEGCKAESTVTLSGKKDLLGRLALDRQTIEKIYAGQLRTWKAVNEEEVALGVANDKVSCATEAELESKINVVVRLDHSGTTHIFKTFLEQVNSAEELEFENYLKEYEGSKTGCAEERGPAKELWSKTAEGCENQRWPVAAEVVRPHNETGNPGVIYKVSATPSSIGYADLAVAREYEYFSKKGFSRANPQNGGAVETGNGGENSKGTETKRGEQNVRFWALVQDSKTAGASYADPSSDLDTLKAANSNCSNTNYIEGEGHFFPPASTLALWNQAKGNVVEEPVELVEGTKIFKKTNYSYSICGLTYDLAFKEYGPFLAPQGVEKAVGEAQATTVENYLMYVVSSSGGAKAVKNHDYEALPSNVVKEDEAGIKQIGWKLL